MTDDDRELWYAVGTHEYFAIPRETELAPGDLVIRSLRGGRRDVDRAAIGAWAIPREEATHRLRDDALSAVGDARDAITRLLDRDSEEAAKLKESLSPDKVGAAFRELGEKVEHTVRSPEVAQAFEKLGAGLLDFAKKLREPTPPPPPERKAGEG